jgi:hypothetical protein
MFNKFTFLFVAALLIGNAATLNAQNVGIGTTTPNASAALDVTSTTKGMLVPRMTQAQRNVIATPAAGLLVYQTDNTPGFYYYDGTTWKNVGAGVGSNGTVTNLTATAPLSVTNGSTTPQISLPQANATTNGFLSNTDWSTFNNKFNLPSLTAGSLLFSDGTGIAQNNSNLFWDNTAGKMSIGKNTIAGTFSVNSANPGYDSPEWIAGNFGGQLGHRVVMGILNGSATIGAHTNPLDGWADLVINPGGFIRLPFYTGIGNQMLVVAPDGLMLATPAATVRSITVEAPLQVANATTLPYIAMPAATSTVSGHLKSDDWNTFNNKQNALANANASVSGILTSADWTTFNNKQNALANANATTSGILTNTDWTNFNNKQNALANANATTSGILTNTDWTNFNSKFILPSLTSGSILFSDGTTIAQKNANFSWNNTVNQLRVSSDNDGTSSGTNGGFNRWISASFGGVAGNRVVMGTQNGEATIGAHTSNLNAWAKLVLNPAGTVNIGSLAGTGVRMVTSDANGDLSTQAIPTGGDNMGNHTATQAINLNNNLISNNGSSTGIKINNSGTVNIGSLAGTGVRMVTSDANGDLSTQAIPTGDNMGNHTATQNLNLNNNVISNNGSSTGIRIDNSGTVNVGFGSSTTAPPAYDATNGVAPRNLVVNGSVRQSYYIVPVTIPPYSNVSISWTHNLDYEPIVMMSTDQNGGGSNMDFCTYTTYNTTTNETVFIVRNTGANAASGNFRWILVH